METIKTFVREDNITTIACPSCKKTKNTSVASFKNKCHFLKVRCPCKNVFKVQLDFRQYYRKPTDLPGTYVCTKPAGLGGGRMTVEDISLGGVGMLVNETHELKVGCILKLTFTLDDRKKTPLKKQVIIRSIKGNFIGCEFTDKDLYEKQLGFYLKT